MYIKSIQSNYLFKKGRKIDIETQAQKQINKQRTIGFSLFNNARLDNAERNGVDGVHARHGLRVKLGLPKLDGTPQIDSLGCHLWPPSHKCTRKINHNLRNITFILKVDDTSDVSLKQKPSFSASCRNFFCHQQRPNEIKLESRWDQWWSRTSGRSDRYWRSQVWTSEIGLLGRWYPKGWRVLCGS